MSWNRRDTDAERSQLEEHKNAITMIGRPRAGKSLLVGSLLRQAGDSVHSFEEHKPVFSPIRGEGGGNPDELIDYINGFVRGVEFPATYIHKILDYRMLLECDVERKVEKPRLRLLNRRLPEMRREKAKIVVNDAAGGLLMGSDAGNQPHSQTQRVEDFKKIVRSSRSIVYCLPVDETDLDLTASFKQFDVINQLRNNEKIGLERLVLCLTKYEALWTDQNCDAFDEACDLDTFKAHAKRIIPDNMRIPLMALSSQDPGSETGSRVEVCVAPVSAFGFVRDNGCVNFNSYTKRLLVESGSGSGAEGANGEEWQKLNRRSSMHPPYYSDAEAIRCWQPFFVVDPFIYAAFGLRGRLTVDLEDLE